MKTTIRNVFGILIFALLFLSLPSCSESNAPAAKQHKNSIIAQEKQKAPPMIVRQFGCCKAHQ